MQGTRQGFFVVFVVFCFVFFCFVFVFYAQRGRVQVITTQTCNIKSQHSHNGLNLRNITGQNVHVYAVRRGRAVDWLWTANYTNPHHLKRNRNSFT